MLPLVEPTIKSGPEPGYDPLLAYRDRLMFAISLVGVIALLPFSLNDFFQGRDILGWAIFSVVVVLGVDAIAFKMGKAPPLPYALLLLPAAAAITISLRTQGVIGAFWCYPTVLFFHFVLSRRLANVCSVLLLIEAAFMVDRYISLGVSVRFFVSLGLTIIIINITQSVIRDLQLKLWEQTITDSLTGAFNRRHMELRLAEAIEASRRRAAAASLLMMDLDHFKKINDTFGHEAGDRVLKGFVVLVNRRSRKLDILFRAGGEEFVLLLPDTTAPDAVKLAEALRMGVGRAGLLDDRPVTVSIGVAGLDPSDSIDSWLKNADDALYSAKKSGRNRVAAAPSSIDNQAQ